MSDYIGPLIVPTRVQHAEVNGSQIVASTAMPVPVMHALATLVDAVSAAFRERDDADREADAGRTRRPCPRHVGQLRDYCGPCRSEKLERPDEGVVPEPPATTTAAQRAAIQAAAEAVAVAKLRRTTVEKDEIAAEGTA